MMTKNLGVRGLPALASWHTRRVAEELDDPAWLGVATWMRSRTLGGPSRTRMLELSEAGAHEIEPRIGSGDRELQVYGMLRLNAALAAALRRPDEARSHLADAAELANRRGPRNVPTDAGSPACTSGRTTSASGRCPSPSKSANLARRWNSWPCTMARYVIRASRVRAA